MQRMAIVVILAVLGGCAAQATEAGAEACSCPPGPQGPQGPQGPRGDPGPPGASSEAGYGWRSGSRLTALVIHGEDGASQPMGWWDEELQVTCIVTRLEGELRCVPFDVPWQDEFSVEQLARFHE